MTGLLDAGLSLSYYDIDNLEWPPPDSSPDHHYATETMIMTPDA